MLQHCFKPHNFETLKTAKTISLIGPKPTAEIAELELKLKLKLSTQVK